MAQLKLSTKVIVDNAMASMLELGTGTLSQHVGLAFDDYAGRHHDSLSKRAADEIVEQLNALGFKW